MKLLLDQGLPRSSAAILREAGFDAVHAGEISLATAEDELILQRARSEGRIIVTLSRLNGALRRNVTFCNTIPNRGFES